MANESKYNYLFCIGAQKAGTSYLYQIMKQHEAIKFSDFKETHFFSDEKLKKKSIETYLSYFQPDANTEYIADFTPNYISKPDSLERIREEFGDKARIIIMMRDPVKRAFSNYTMAFLRGRERRKFSEVAKNSESHILKKGLYADQLDYVFRNFTRDQVLLLVFEKFIREKQKTMDEISDFLCIERMEFDFNVKKNSAKNYYFTFLGTSYFKIPFNIRRSFQSKVPLLGRIIKKILRLTARSYESQPVMDENDRKELVNFYSQANERLAKEYEVDISEWR